MRLMAPAAIRRLAQYVKFRSGPATAARRMKRLRRHLKTEV
jgi:hypothetical protein